MDKQFWLSIKENNFAFPAGYSVPTLTEELFTNLASTDPELRDTIGLEAFYHWLKEGIYSEEDVRNLIPRLIANLQKGLGETEDDSVFLRSFSALWLAVIVEHDIEKLTLKKEDIGSILEAALAYFTAERDLRGLVPEKGWGHAIAHTADLFCALAHSVHTDANDHAKILDCIASKLRSTSNWIYLYGEDGRLARVAIIIFIRETLTMDQIKEWLISLSKDWNGAWWDEGRTRAFFNGRNFSRAIHWRIPLLKVDKVPNKETILKMLEDTLEQAEPWR
jgi:hypothetical protein